MINLIEALIEKINGMRIKVEPQTEKLLKQEKTNKPKEISVQSKKIMATNMVNLLKMDWSKKVHNQGILHKKLD